jgi:CRISPR-associated protein Csm4
MMMKLYKTTITPLSNFATSLKGDTLFGQMCWAIRYTFGNERLETLLSNYDSSPFLVVSDGFVSDYLPKPSLPHMLLGEDSDDKKTNRKKIWLTLQDLQTGNFINAKTDDEVKNNLKTVSTVKNSLNYKTFTTDDSGTFAPYSENESFISPKDIYFLVSDNFTLAELDSSLQTLSKMGFGKNASIGKGFFTFSDFQEVNIYLESTTLMTLSPSSIEKLHLKDCHYEPFTRFGKHGANLANTNPFKKPLLLANTGAVVVFEENYPKPYIGKAIKGHSTHKNTVHQGYAIVVPIKEINL